MPTFRTQLDYLKGTVLPGTAHRHRVSLPARRMEGSHPSLSGPTRPSGHWHFRQLPELESWALPLRCHLKPLRGDCDSYSPPPPPPHVSMSTPLLQINSFSSSIWSCSWARNPARNGAPGDWAELIGAVVHPRGYGPLRLCPQV